MRKVSTWIKDEIFTVCQDMKCDIIYRPFSEEMFPLTLDCKTKSITIITYTPPTSILTILELIEKNYSHIECIELVIGLAYVKPEKKGKSDSANKLENDLLENIEKFVGKLYEIHDKYKEIKITFHNHCHIKYFQAGSVCLTGSQNFSGTIFQNNNASKYSKNELLIFINEIEPKLKAMSLELIKYLHAHNDEFVRITKDDIVNNKINAEIIRNEIIEKRLRPVRERDNYENTFNEIDNDLYNTIMSDIEESEKEDEKNKNLPIQFSVYKFIENEMIANNHPKKLLLAIKYLEDAFSISEISDFISAKKEETTEALEKNIDILFENMNWSQSCGTDILPPESCKEILYKELQSQIENIVYKQMEDLLTYILELCLNTLESYNLHDISEYVHANLYKIKAECLEPPSVLPLFLSEVVDDFDLLDTRVEEFLYEHTPNNVDELAPKHYKKTLEKITREIINFEILN